ncbi:MAG: arsenate reductase ArsC [Endomicrobiales bacterium]|nr:arsenate reductase ArsC [Endomicrobiales bacterium]
MEKKIIFICTHNANRSQMAEAIMRSLYGNVFEVYSAGTRPTKINPITINVLKDIGIDASNQRPKHINEFKNIKFDYVITLCNTGKEDCPFVAGATKYIHKAFDDPSELKGSDEELLSGFKRVRDEIKDWLQEELNIN